MLQSVAFQPHSVSSRHPSSTFEPGNIIPRYSIIMHYPLQKILVVTQCLSSPQSQTQLRPAGARPPDLEKPC